MGKPIDGEQKVPADVGAQSQKLWMRCQKPPEMRHACNAARASEDACDCCVSAYYQVQMAAAPKQAVSFAGEQRALGIIGAPPQKLSMECLKPLEERQACSAARASEDGYSF